MKRILLALLLSLSLMLTGCHTAAPGPASGTATPSPAVTTPTPTPTPAPEPIVATLVVAGDVMSHMPITNDAYVAETDSYDYSHMMAQAAPQLLQAHYAVANLETTLAGGPRYSGYPNFNAPDALARDAKAAGFDLLSTANNHSMDKGASGVYRTLDVLDQVGLAHVGTHRTAQERDCGAFVADVGGISVAFLSYTYGLNGYALPDDAPHAVNVFNLDYTTTLEHPDYDTLTADLAQARALDADLVAVLIHWGMEYQNAPNHHQTELAQFLVEQGADLVLGGHPHVLQPYETIQVTGWDGSPRQGFVCYSLGNFISNQQELSTKTTAVLALELTQDPATGETALTDVGYTPYYMVHLDGAPVGQRRYLADIHRAMAAYEAGESGAVDPVTYGRLEEALAHCHAILGSRDDLG